MKRVTSWVSLVEPTLAKELRSKGAYIASLVQSTSECQRSAPRKKDADSNSLARYRDSALEAL